jgi:OOP family OmpA-OmpF porin
MKKHLLIALAAIAPVAASAADYATYLGASVGRSEMKISVDHVGSVNDNAAAFKLFAGIQANENVGIELGYAELGKFGLNSIAGSATAKPQPIYLALTGTLPLKNGFALHAKAGAVRSRTDYGFSGVAGNERYSTTTNLWGVGASFAMSGNMTAIVEYETYGNLVKSEDFPGSMKTQMMSVGLRFAF